MYRQIRLQGRKISKSKLCFVSWGQEVFVYILKNTMPSVLSFLFFKFENVGFYNLNSIYTQFIFFGDCGRWIPNIYSSKDT